MAWFRRDKNREDPATPDPEVPAAAEPDGDVIRQERPSTGDWMAMPAMATTGPIQPTFRVQTLPDILTSHHSPAVSGSLGHAVSADAPSGVVSGLALFAGSRSSTTTAGDFTLQTPHPPSHGEDLAPLARPLTSVTPEPLPVSTLPEPAVSRSASNPLPLASPVTAGRDVPVARVIEGAPTSSSSSSLSPDSPADAPTGGSAPSSPEAPDLRVGGFDLSALDPVTDAPDAELFSSRPADLAPPIQPRTLQRRAAGARPIEVAPHLRTPSVDATTPAAPTAPLLGTDDAVSETSATAPTADLEQVARADNAVDLPLHAPNASSAAGSSEGPTTAAVQRRAEDTPHEAPPHPIGDAVDTSAPAAEISSDAPTLHADGVTTNSAAELVDEPAPLAGQRPLTDLGDAGAAGDAGGTIDGTDLGSSFVDAPGAVESLPLVAPRSAASASTGVDPITVSRSADADDDAGDDAGAVDEVTVSTLGVLAPSASAQPLTSAGEATHAEIGSPAGPLPLAPTDWQESLDAPAGTTPTVQRQAEGGATSASISASTITPSLRPGAPMTLAATRPVGGGTGLASLSTLAPSTTSVAQRLAAAAAVPATTAATSLAGSSGSPGSSGPSPLPTTLARSAGPSPTGGTSGPSVALRTPRPDAELPDVITAEALSVSRAEGRASAAEPGFTLDSADGSSEGLTLQRSAGGDAGGPGGSSSAPSTASNNSTANAMPLHTPATAIPSAADVAVSAGLAERGPDGTIRYPHVPVGADASAQSEFVVQRAPDGTPGASGSTTPSPISVRPALEVGSSEASPQPAPDSVGDLADQARKLYPHIRSQLESDIRRQLEARNRANRPT